MKLVLDEKIIREVIDTLYMARTALLGITGLDSTQEVSKKSANETSITLRISRAIDIIQQSEQPELPGYDKALLEVKSKVDELYEDAGIGLCEYDCGLYNGIAETCMRLRGFIKARLGSDEQPESELEKAARYVYESWMGGTMDDVRRDMVELGKVLNARKEE